MRTYDLTDEQRRLFAFEVSNTLIGRIGACAVARGISGVSNLVETRDTAGKDEICSFELSGERFIICEPFGDNSRFWIGTEPPHWCPEGGDGSERIPACERIQGFLVADRNWRAPTVITARGQTHETKIRHKEMAQKWSGLPDR
jgi:hypothetical protein